MADENKQPTKTEELTEEQLDEASGGSLTFTPSQPPSAIPELDKKTTDSNSTSLFQPGLVNHNLRVRRARSRTSR
jgi:hypothetical protein